MPYTFGFKIQDKRGRMHRFTCDTRSLTNLISAVLHRLGDDRHRNNVPQILYEDEDHDKVVLASDYDLQVAVEHAKLVGLKGLRLHLDYSGMKDRRRSSNSRSLDYANSDAWTTAYNTVAAGAAVVAGLGLLAYLRKADNPLEVKKLISDGDVLEMVRNVPRDHYLHIYIVEVEPESRIEIESDSNSEDEEYKVEDESSTNQSKFSDSENELASSEDEIFNVNVGLGSDKVEVETPVNGEDLATDSWQIRSGKNLAIENLNGNHKEQYAKLYAYLDELRQSNPGKTTVCKLDDRKFERLYICMQAMKDGFKAGYRPIIGLDGCHLKGYYQGHLLAAVGIDANDSIYPISFAAVESENQSSSGIISH
ncbi:hypothetical protein V6N13_123294 [Hibiscus sabdariffa]